MLRTLMIFRDRVDDVVINLDLEPEERWKDITVKMKPQVIYVKCGVDLSSPTTRDRAFF